MKADAYYSFEVIINICMKLELFVGIDNLTTQYQFGIIIVIRMIILILIINY